MRSIVRRRESPASTGPPDRRIRLALQPANNRLTSLDDVEHALSTADRELLKVSSTIPTASCSAKADGQPRPRRPTAPSTSEFPARRKLEPDAHSLALHQDGLRRRLPVPATVAWSGDNAQMPGQASENQILNRYSL